MANPGLEEEWRIELQSVLTVLATYLRKCPPTDRPVIVPIAGDRIKVTPGEREILLRTAERGGAAVARHFRLISDGLALRAKLLEDGATLDDAADEARGQAGAVMGHDVDLGYKLVHAMQGEIAVLMATGKVESGRRLAEHRGYLTEALQHARQRLVGAGFEAPAAPAPTSAADEQGTSPPRSGGRGEGGKSARWLSQVVAGLLFALLALLLLQIWSNRAKDLPPLTVNDFGSFQAVEQVVCRPPAVILVVSRKGWASLSPDARVQAVQESSLAVEHLGYRSVEIRTAGGTPLAVWRKGKKVVVYR